MEQTSRTDTYDELRLQEAFLEYGCRRLEAYNRGDGEPLDGKTLEVIGRLLEKADIGVKSRSGHDALTIAQGDKAAAALLKKYGSS